RLCVGATAPPRVNTMAAPFLGLDDEPLEHAIAGISNQASRVEREHLLVAPETGASAKATVEPEDELRDLAPLGPGRCNPIEPLAVAAVDQDHVGDMLAQRVERGPDAGRKGLRLLG